MLFTYFLEVNSFYIKLKINGKAKATNAVQTAYIGINAAIFTSISCTPDFPFKFLSIEIVTNNKCININKFAPKTANLFGDTPNSASLNIIAESAIALATIVNKERMNKKIKCILDLSLLVTSVNENKIIAITAISNALNNKRKLRSL